MIHVISLLLEIASSETEESGSGDDYDQWLYEEDKNNGEEFTMLLSWCLLLLEELDARGGSLTATNKYRASISWLNCY